MTSEAATQWVISVLLATPAVVAHWSGPNRVGPHDDEGFPSAEGAWVTAETEAKNDRVVDEVVLRVYVVKKGRRTDCANAMRDVRNAMNLDPGEPKTWAATPASKSLRVKKIQLLPSAPAGKSDADQDYYAGILRYRISGRATALTA